MRFGINTWAWRLPVGQGEMGEFLDWASSLGIPGERPVIEVFASPLAEDLTQAEAIRDLAAARGFGVVACGFNPNMTGPDTPSPHLVSPDAAERAAAVERACGFVRYAAAVAVPGDAAVLSGPWHTRHFHFTGTGLTAAERGWLVDGLGRIAAVAEDLGVLAGFEILNRFESYVINTLDEALDVIDEVGSPNLGVNWDTGHAHIDEDEDLVTSLKRAVASGRLFHMHLCENHRREYGTGKIGPRTAELFAALRDGGYARGVVPELFCEALDGAVHKWIRREGDVTGAARRSFQYLNPCL